MVNEKSVMAVIRASRPMFRDDNDKIAFLVHSSFLAHGYVLTGVGYPDLSDDALSSSSTDEVAIDGWNKLKEEYAFVYVNPDKDSRKVLVKCLVMNEKLLVDAFAYGESESLHVEIDVEDYVKESDKLNYSAHFKNTDKLVSKLDKEILTKLDGPKSSSSTGRSSRTNTGSRRPELGPAVVVPVPLNPRTHPPGVIIPPVYHPCGGTDLYLGPGASACPSMIVPLPPVARFDPVPLAIPGFENWTIYPGPVGGTHPDLQHFKDD